MRFATRLALVSGLAVSLPTVVFAQTANDPGIRFDSMDLKVRKAKTLQCDLDIRVTGTALKSATFKGTLAYQRPNKIRLHLDGQVEGKAVKVDMLADGQELHVTRNGAGTSQPLPKGFDSTFRAVFGRTGLFAPMLLHIFTKGQNLEDFKVDEQLKVSGFEPGGKGPLAGREVLIVKHKLRLPRDRVVSVTLWFPMHGHLPLERELTGKEGGTDFSITEVYSNWRYDQPVDASVFQSQSPERTKAAQQ
jgi:outer membrane lipoprotein-sorting protein